MARRSSTPKAIHAPGANATFKRALSTSSWPRGKPRSGRRVTPTSNTRLSGRGGMRLIRNP